MREMASMILVLSLICGVAGFTLATVREATKPRIEEQVLTYVQGPAIKEVFTAPDNDPVKDRKKFKLNDGSEVTVFPSIKSGKLAGVAFETFGKGFGGDIGIMVGFNLSGGKATLAGIGITTMKETPGIGTRILETGFRKQFMGLPVGKIALKSKGGQVDAISGATVSSVGTVVAVDNAVKIFNQIKDKLPTAWGSS